jgi:hypothetical protein
MPRLLLLLLVLLGTPALAFAVPAPGRVYEEGQVWAFTQDGAESEGRVKIRLIEQDPKGAKIYHVTLVGLSLVGGTVTEVQHLPVSRETLDSSVTRLDPAERAFPDYREGYEEWRRANGGVFTITIAEILLIVEQTLARPPADSGPTARRTAAPPQRFDSSAARAA